MDWQQAPVQQVVKQHASEILQDELGRTLATSLFLQAAGCNEANVALVHS